MKIIIGDRVKTLTFEVNGNLEDIVTIKQSLERLPNLLVVEKISKFMERDDSTISVTCPVVSYNDVIKILQDFIADEY